MTYQQNEIPYAQPISFEPQKELSFIEKIKGFILRPSNTFDSVFNEKVDKAIKYYIPLLVFFSLLSGIIFAPYFRKIYLLLPNEYRFLGETPEIVTFYIICIVGLFVTNLVNIFISSAIIHIFVYLVGGRKGISQTLKAFMYGTTPHLLFGWLPFIGFIFSIWTLILNIIGVRQLHKISTIRSVLAVFIIPLIIVIIIIIIIITVVIVALMDGQVAYLMRPGL